MSTKNFIAGLGGAIAPNLCMNRYSMIGTAETRTCFRAVP
jgi:hypothetical protein